MPFPGLRTKFVYASFLLLANMLGMCWSSIPRFSPDSLTTISPCSFDHSKKDYDGNDLLGCLNELIQTLINEEGISRTALERAPGYPSESEDYPIKNDKEITQSYDYQPYNHGLPSYGRPPVHYPTAGLGYLTPLQVVPGGSSLSLFNALTSISRYDDFKCIPRIVCEVAAGVIPSSDVGYTRSTTSSLIQLGRNTLVGLLNMFDTTGTFPLLNFAKAAVLGYSNRGNSNTCYREYSKCPRNPSDLVYYLNNHNGGFFRLFSQIGNIYENNLRAKSSDIKGDSRVEYFPTYSDIYEEDLRNYHEQQTKTLPVIQKANDDTFSVPFLFPTQIGNDGIREGKIISRIGRKNRNGIKFPCGEDYLRGSCLIDETWIRDNDDCVPMKYKDIDEDYVHVFG